MHDAQHDATVEREAITRLNGMWPALSDHVALHAVFVRRPSTQENNTQGKKQTNLRLSDSGAAYGVVGN